MIYIPVFEMLTKFSAMSFPSQPRQRVKICCSCTMRCGVGGPALGFGATTTEGHGPVLLSGGVPEA